MGREGCGVCSLNVVLLDFLLRLILAIGSLFSESAKRR